MKQRSHFAAMMRLIGLVKPLLFHMMAAIFTGLVGHLAASFITILAGFALLSAIGETALSYGQIFLFMAVFAASRGLLRYAEQTFNHYIAFKLLALIRDKVFTALRRLCPAKLEGKDKGNLITLIGSDIELLEVFYAHTISPIAIAFLFTLAIALFLFKFHPLLALILVLAHSTIGIALPLYISKRNGQSGLILRQNTGKLASFVLESLRGLNETIQFGRQEKRLHSLRTHTDSLLSKEEQMKELLAQNMAIGNTVIFFFIFLMLAVSSALYSVGAIGFAGLLTAVLTLISSFGPALALAGLGSTLQSTFAAANRVIDLLDESPQVDDISGKSPVSFEGARFEHVSFAYKDEEILNDFSLPIQKGKFLGIVGKSGSGKSTLLKLLMRFWRPSAGRISISERNLEDINTSDLRDMISYLTQDTQLFKDSIKNNLKIAKEDASQEEIEAACKKAAIHDFILGLKDGYDTQLGELGDTLSGGERQRLGLARAFLKNADLLLLDEPTSNLDSLNEAMILKALSEEKGGRSIVLVSHRKSTLSIADEIVQMDSGRQS